MTAEGELLLLLLPQIDVEVDGRGIDDATFGGSGRGCCRCTRSCGLLEVDCALVF